MNTRSVCVKLLLAASLSLLSPLVWGQDGLSGALPQTRLTSPIARNLAAADLDNDKKPDGAVLLNSGWLRSGSFKIQLHLTDRPNAELTFESTHTALSLRAADINNDGSVDLVVEEAIGHKPLYVWINQGHGEFHRGRVEDFPALTPATDAQLQSPPDPQDALALCMPSQRGFEITFLTTPLLSRPPSTDHSQVLSAGPSFASRTYAPNSPRAPPLS
jgi:hypothetical protein